VTRGGVVQDSIITCGAINASIVNLLLGVTLGNDVSKPLRDSLELLGIACRVSVDKLVIEFVNLLLLNPIRATSHFC
jgi:hypothetical protein